MRRPTTPIGDDEETEEIINDAPSLDPNAVAKSVSKSQKPGIYWAGWGIAVLMGLVWLAESSGFGLGYIFGNEEKEPDHVVPQSGSMRISLGVPTIGDWTGPAAATQPVDLQAEERQPEHPAPPQDDEQQARENVWGDDGDDEEYDDQEQRHSGEPIKPPRLSSILKASVSGAPPSKYGVDATQPKQWFGCALRLGDAIAATLLSDVDTQLSGQIHAVVKDTFYSSDNPSLPLIPKGTKFVGLYGIEQAGAGGALESKAAIRWIGATFPPGWGIPGLDLTKSEVEAMDGGGAMGVGGEVNHRWGQLFAVAALQTLINIGSRSATPPGSGYAAELQNSATAQSSDVFGNYGKQVLNANPQIKIKPGTRVLISPRTVLKVSERCHG